MPKIIASLFSGCGGLDLGFTGGFTFRGQIYDRLNTEILFANDFDQDAIILLISVMMVIQCCLTTSNP